MLVSLNRFALSDKIDKNILGNDFEALSGAFVGRSASEIKRKFIRENKADPAKIDALLKVHASGESDWDLTRLREADAEFHAEIEKNEELKQTRKRERQENAAKKAARYSFPKEIEILTINKARKEET